MKGSHAELHSLWAHAQTQEADRGGQAAVCFLAVPVHAGKVMPPASLLLLRCTLHQPTAPPCCAFVAQSLTVGCVLAGSSWCTCCRTCIQIPMPFGLKEVPNRRALQARTLKRGHTWALLPLDPSAWLVMLSQHHASLQQQLARQADSDPSQLTLPGTSSSSGGLPMPGLQGTCPARERSPLLHRRRWRWVCSGLGIWGQVASMRVVWVSPACSMLVESCIRLAASM